VVRRVLTLPADVPVLPNVLHATREEALAAPRGAMDLAVCQSCSLVWNVAFDDQAVAYTQGYENSLHFSGAFQAYARELAARLVVEHGLQARTVVEIGCGGGEFLAMLAEAGAGECRGFDPSFDPARLATLTVDRVSIEPRAFLPGDADCADFVCCRHVLEHLADPAAVLQSLRGDGGTVPGYLEVPNGACTVRAGAIWDLIYEHPLYFSEAALRALCERTGLEVARTGTSFAGQYLWAELGTPAASDSAPPPDSYMEGEVERFVAAFTSTLATWEARIAEFSEAGEVVIWGAGSKGVSFLNLVAGACQVRRVVDVNPNKHGRFIPGTGHIVVAPDALVAQPPATVVVMNPLYTSEIEATLAGLGLHPRVEPAW
jgi:SAM-dependent methyltransferase